MPSILGYWNIQVLGHPIRFLLSYVGEEFENKLYVQGPAPDFDRSDWLSKKFTLGLDFPNLPYYIDENVKISQSNTILRYLGRKYNMAGTTDSEKTRVDLALDQILDNRWAMVTACYHPTDYEKLRSDYIELLPGKLKLYEEFLGDRQFIAGENVTVADFTMYAMLRENELFVPNCLNGFPTLQGFAERFQSLPQIKAYKESDKYLKLPLNNKVANFGTTEGW